jgi:endonuclease/exonuclease/phosphatase family metal-dependent hydrolase
MGSQFKVVTYNIHKCIGMDRRYSPERIVDVLHEINADIVALQEVVCIEDSPRENQLLYIAEHSGLKYYCMGENRRIRGGAYGNAIISRYPFNEVVNYDITKQKREPRGCLRADIKVGSSLLHLFNAHLGTSFLERRHQARLLVSNDILNNGTLFGKRILVGDFNEWTRGLTTRLLKLHLESIDLRYNTLWARSYPGLLPILHLDHIYFDQGLGLENFSLHRSRKALLASDHLPLIANFAVE